MGFWSKLAKGLAIGGAAVATGMTGGAAAPLLGAAIGGVNGSNNGGGWKGALTGAVGGGLTGLAGGAGGAAKGLTGTASTLSKLGTLAKIAGPVAAGIASGQQKGREAENTNAQDTANFRRTESNQNEDNIISRADLDLKRREDARTGQSDAYKKALQSALTMNTKDFEIDPASLPRGVSLIKSSGGLRPSALGPEGQAAAAALNKQAMERLLSGEKFDELPALERTQPGEFKKPGALENIAGGIGLGANAINSYNAGNEQQSMQERILAAIEANKGGGAPTATPVNPNVTLAKPGPVGVMPFVKPPPGVLQDPYGNVDESNR